MPHPFADLVGLHFEEQRPGYSRCTLTVVQKHLNPHGVVHGAVAYTLADTGMGAALYRTLDPGELCATVEIKISYFKPVSSGALSCVTEVVNRGKRVASMESSIYAGDALVARASGTYSIFTPGANAG
jgi:acyl-CoA thioesterase